MKEHLKALVTIVYCNDPLAFRVKVRTIRKSEEVDVCYYDLM